MEPVKYEFEHDCYKTQDMCKNINYGCLLVFKLVPYWFAAPKIFINHVNAMFISYYRSWWCKLW